MFNPFRAIFSRLTQAEKDPDQWVYIGRSEAGIRVSHDMAFRLAAFWACVKVISETKAGLSWNVVQRSPNGDQTVLDEHPISVLLNVRPNPEMTAFTFRELMIANALSWGDFYAEIERDLAKRPIAMWPLEPHRVSLKRRNDGSLFYNVWNHDGEPSEIDIADMYHLKGPGPNGYTGYYVVAMFVQAIGLGLAEEKHLAQFFGDNAVPVGFLRTPGNISQEEGAKLIENFEKKHRSRRSIGLLKNGLEFVPLGQTNEDSETRENRIQQTLEMCRIMRVPPHKIAELSRATFSNISQMETSFGRDTIVPWAIRAEQEANWKLFSESDRLRRRRFTKVNVRAMMRGDAITQSQFYTAMRDLGVFSVNDILELEDRNKIGPEGDKRLVQVNMTTLEKIGEDPEPEPEPVRDEVDVEEPLAITDQRNSQREALEQVFLDSGRNIVMREVNKARMAMKKPDFTQWLDSFYADHGDYITQRLAPACAAYAYVLCPSGNRESAMEGIGEAVVAIASDARNELEENPSEATLERWIEERPKEIARTVMGQVENVFTKEWVG